MSVFSVKANGRKVAVVAANVAYVADNKGKGEIVFTGNVGVMLTEVGYDTVRKNLVKAQGKAVADQE